MEQAINEFLSSGDRIALAVAAREIFGHTSDFPLKMVIEGKPSPKWSWDYSDNFRMSRKDLNISFE